MSNYTKATNFATKDALTTGNPLKTLSGTELDDEFNAIQVANNTKANASNAALTGTPVAPTAATATDTTQIATTAFVQANDALQLNLSGGAMTGAITTNSTFDGRDVAADGVLATNALPKSGGAMTGAITTNSTFDGVDIATRDAVLTSTTTTANAALPKAGGALTGAVTTNSTFDGVDIATRDGVLTSTTATAAAALPKAGGTMTGALNVQHAASAVAKFQSTATNGGYVTYVGGSTTYIGAPLSFLGTGTASDFGIIGTGANNFVLGTSSAEKMRINAAGNVGIGTVSPTSPLHITGSGHTALTITGGASSDAQIRFGDSANTTIGMINYDNAINALKFVVNGSSAAIIDSSGNVGIGTSSPSAPLNAVSTYSAGTTTTALKLATVGGYNSNSGTSIDFGQDQGTYATWLTGRISSPRTGDSWGGSLVFSTNDNSASAALAERMRIDSSGNVGIGQQQGTSSTANQRLLINADAQGGIGHGLYIHNDSYSAGRARIALGPRYTFSYNTSPYIESLSESTSAAALVFGTTTGTAATERMRINANGRITTFGTGNVNASLNLLGEGGASKRAISFEDTNGGGEVGKVTTTSSATSYTTSSDYRLKTDVQPMTGATDRVKLLKPCNFEWIVDGTRVDGFIAHEAQEIVPESVHGTKDAMMDQEYEVTPATGDVFTAGVEAGFTEVSPAIVAEPAYYDVDGNVIKAEVIAQAAVHEAYEAIAEVIHSADVEQPETLEEGQQWRETTAAVMGTRSVPDMQGIDQAKLVPLLTATIQELIARIEVLEGGE